MIETAGTVEAGATRTPMFFGRLKSLEEIREAWAEHDEARSAPPTLQVDLA